MRKYFIELMVIATGLGVLWRSFFDFGVSGVVFLWLLSFVSVLTLRTKGTVMAIFLLSVSIGVLRTDLHIDAIEATRPMYGHAVIEGVIVDEPDTRDKNQHVVVATDTTRIRVTLPLSHDLSYGDKVSLDGVIERPTTFTTDEGREFAYEAWLLKDGITAIMAYPKVSIIGKHEGNRIKEFLFSHKERFLGSLQRVIPEPQMSLLGGLLLGAKESMGEELLHRFRDTGLIHIVVLSGYNVSIIADWLLRALGFLPTGIGAFVGGISIILFAILTGGSATIVRASIMALIVLLSRVVGRNYNITRALIIAGGIMVLFHPLILAFDPSFQLSFLATIGIIYFTPIMQRMFGRMTRSFSIREILATTCATQLFVLPHLLWFSGAMSLIAPLSNIAVLLVVPLAMALGFITGVIGLLPSPLSLVAVVPGAVTSMVLSYQLAVTTWLSELPFITLHIPQFSYWVALLMYGGLYGVYYYARKEKRDATVSKFIA